MTRATRAAALALIATVGAWPALDEKLQSYPSIHARETAKIKAGDAKGARYILFDAFHGHTRWRSTRTPQPHSTISARQ